MLRRQAGGQQVHQNPVARVVHHDKGYILYLDPTLFVQAIILRIRECDASTPTFLCDVQQQTNPLSPHHATTRPVVDIDMVKRPIHTRATCNHLRQQSISLQNPSQYVCVVSFFPTPPAILPCPPPVLCPLHEEAKIDIVPITADGVDLEQRGGQSSGRTKALLMLPRNGS